MRVTSTLKERTEPDEKSSGKVELKGFGVNK